MFPPCLEAANPAACPAPEWAEGTLYFQSEEELFRPEPKPATKQLKRIESDDDFVAHFTSLMKGEGLGSSFKHGLATMGDDQKMKLREEDEWFALDPFANPKEDAVH